MKSNNWFVERALLHQMGKQAITYTRTLSQIDDNLYIDEEDYNMLSKMNGIISDKTFHIPNSSYSMSNRFNRKNKK